MTYVMSDIHGNERRFDSILKQIDLQPEDTLYILGDVIDRHPGGIRILRRIMAMPNVTMILGNHEYMMLRALGRPVDDYWDDGGAKAHWYRNGGDVTHRHFKFLRKSLRGEILDYLQQLPLNLQIRVGERDYLLAHATTAASFDREKADPIYRSAAHYAVWRRMEAQEPFAGEGTLIFGHTPTRYFRDVAPMEIWYGEDRIGIDCGGGYPECLDQAHAVYGRLACLRLDDGRVFYSAEPGSRTDFILNRLRKVEKPGRK